MVIGEARRGRAAPPTLRESGMPEENKQAPADLRTEHACEGGNLDCGSGLLLLIRNAMQAVPAGEILEIRSTEISVREDLPA